MSQVSFYPCNGWTRTIINAWADAMLREEPGPYPVLGLLDEFPTSVGNLSSIETLAAMGAGYGCQLITVVQNLNQLANLMPNGWQTALGNTGFQIHGAPGAGDLFTSRHISAMCGSVEVESLSRAVSDKKWLPQFGGGLPGTLNNLGSLASGGDQVTIGQRTKPYLSPDEIRELDDNEALVWVEGVKGVIRAGRRPYYQDPLFAGKYDEDPYHTKKSR
jgi:type IV secretory pathway TraG/TraD family ATPase VirD4